MHFRAALTITVISLALVVASMFVPVRHEKSWIDPITGSTKSETTYLTWTREPTIQHSALDAWVRNRNPSYVNQWIYRGGGESNIWNRRLVHACGSPDVVPLHGAWNEQFVKTSTDQELEDFVRAMQDADPKIRQAAVDAALIRSSSRSR